MSLPFRFAGAALVARGSGALWWPDYATLVVSDLHLGKSERMARRGGALLPPFETRETLARLRAEIDALRPLRVVMLGDTFDDDAAATALDAEDAAMLNTVAGAVECIFVTGNHDAAHGAAEITLGGIALRHIAGTGPDISGHYHPKASVAGQSRPAFLIGADHLILPAFGAYTGGLRADTPVLRALIGRGVAILTGSRPVAVPLRA